MAELIDFESEPGSSTTLRDKRRPGRPKFAHPNLIPLLRGDTPPVEDTPVEVGDAVVDTSVDTSVDTDRKATLSAARGICLGVALGSLIWGGIGAGFWYYFSG